MIASTSYASRSGRLLGQILDAIVGVGPFFLFALTAGEPGDRTPYLSGLSVLWACFYYLFADGLPGGQSVGKRMLDMRVVSADTGEACTFFQSFLRNLLLAILGPIDWVFIFGDRHQRLGDKAAGTVVIDT